MQAVRLDHLAIREPLPQSAAVTVVDPFTRSVRDRALALFSADPEVSMSQAKVFVSWPDY